MLSFLWSFYKKHKGTLTTLSVLSLTLFGTIWSYDIKQLTLSGTLTHQETLRIRSFLTLITISLYFLSLLITLLYHYKKDTEKYEAKLNPPKTFAEVNQQFINTLTEEKKEPIKSALPDKNSPTRSFPGPRIPEKDTLKTEDINPTKSAFDTAYERLMKLSKPK